jgi:hypothetical protein
MPVKSKRELKRRYLKDIDVVQEALRRWDPIEVIEDQRHQGVPLTEYDRYAPHILSLLQRGCSAKDIAAFLTLTEEESMELGGVRLSGLTRNRQIAMELVSWWGKTHER